MGCKILLVSLVNIFNLKFYNFCFAVFLAFALICTFRKFLFFNYPWYILLWNINDLFLGVYTLIKFIQCSAFFTNVSIMSAVVFINQMNLLKKKSLLKIIVNTKRKIRTPCSVKAMKMVINFLVEHNTICYLIMSGNSPLWGPVMAAFVLTNLPVNVYVLSQLVLSTGDNSFIELLVLITILTVQIAAFYINMRPMSNMCKELHALQSTIVSLQQHLMSGQWNLLKLKLDDLKERLSCGPKVAVTIGSAREVTGETIIEVSHVLLKIHLNLLFYFHSFWEFTWLFFCEFLVNN